MFLLAVFQRKNIIFATIGILGNNWNRFLDENLFKKIYIFWSRNPCLVPMPNVNHKIDKGIGYNVHVCTCDREDNVNVSAHY
jgi:hypothetical protein